jgi:hypothetical protein
MSERTLQRVSDSPPVGTVDQPFRHTLDTREATADLIERRFMYTFVFLIGAAPAIYFALTYAGFFNSPDETARYAAAELFAESRTLAIRDEITQLAEAHGAPSAPRGWVTNDGEAVPIYAPGHLLLTAAVTWVFGPMAPLVLAAIPGALAVLILATVRRLFPATSWLGVAAVVGSAPLWYWSGRVYLEAALFVLLLCGAVYCFVAAVTDRPADRGGTLQRLALAGLLLGLVPTVRTAEATLAVIAVGLMLLVWWRLRATRMPFREPVAALGGGFAVGMLLFFALNWWLYGSPLTTGYTLFYEAEFPERVQDASGPIGTVIGLFRLALFPQPVDPGTAVHTAVYNFLLLVPVGIAVAVVGAWMAGRRAYDLLGPTVIAAAVITALYLIISRSDPESFLARGPEPDLLASLVRYWLPLHLVVVFLGVLALGNMRPVGLAVALAVVLVAAGGYDVWYGNREAVTRLPTTTEVVGTQFEAFLTETTEENALVVAGSSTDKWAAPVRRTIGIWYLNSTPESLTRLAGLMADVAERGRPVYLLTGPLDHPEILDVMDGRLSDRDLHLQHVGTPIGGEDGGWSMWRVERLTTAARPVAGSDAAR